VDRTVQTSHKTVLNDVLAHYNLGTIHSMESFSGGRRRAAKWIIQTDRGRYLLKQRPAASRRVARTRLAHTLQGYLRAAHFPLAELVPTQDDGKTLLTRGRYLYELFHWIEGQRCSGTEAAITAAGRQMGCMHRHAAPLPASLEIPIGGFHDADRVRQHLKKLGQPRDSANAAVWRGSVDSLMMYYNRCSVRVNQQGYESWPVCANHGDWHPGNLLYRGDKVVAVLDFDALQVAPAVADIANGLLQFSLVAGDPRPSHWPARCDHRRLLYFWGGYCEVASLQKEQIAAIIDLMAETLVAEAVLPIAATGIFDQPHGLDFLQMILRKVNWLLTHRSPLVDALQSIHASHSGQASKAAS
jgi:homoserine kinase type II